MKIAIITSLTVLAIASATNAGLVFTVNDAQLPNGSTVVLQPSDALELVLELSGGSGCGGYDLGYTLTNSGAEFITGGGYGYDPITFPTLFDILGEVIAEEPQYVRINAIQLFSVPILGPAVLMENLLVHQLDSTPVDLIITVDGTTIIGEGGIYETIPIGTVLYTLQIIPEPGTLLLLGLGGLLLRSGRTKNCHNIFLSMQNYRNCV